MCSLSGYQAPTTLRIKVKVQMIPPQFWSAQSVWWGTRSGYCSRGEKQCKWTIVSNGDSRFSGRSVETEQKRFEKILLLPFPDGSVTSETCSELFHYNTKREKKIAPDATLKRRRCGLFCKYVFWFQERKCAGSKTSMNFSVEKGESTILLIGKQVQGCDAKTISQEQEWI